MEWDEAAEEYINRAEKARNGLASLPVEWQREVVALFQCLRGVNNGGYLQFLVNYGRETYVYASQAFKSIGAHRMAEIIDECQTLVDEHYPTEGKKLDERSKLMPNQLIRGGRVVKERGSVLPDETVSRIYELSYEFMRSPDNVGNLGKRHFGPLIAADRDNLNAV